MEDKVEEIYSRIKGWMLSNRMGVLEGEPYFWSIYKVASINTTPVKNTAPASENISIDSLEPSLTHLMQCMSYSTHVKYYFIRLRTKKGDPGVVNNYENPYYQAPYNKSSIGNLQQAPQGDSTLVLMLGMFNSMQEDRRNDKDESQQTMLQLLLQQKDSDHKLEKYKLKQEMLRLKEEKESAVSGGEKSFIRDLFTELKPDIIEGLKYMAGRNTPYKENDYLEEEKEEEGEQVKDNNNETVLSKALGRIANLNIKNPEALVSKISVVLANVSEEDRNNLLGGIQSQYDQIKENKSTNNE